METQSPAPIQSFLSYRAISVWIYRLSAVINTCDWRNTDVSYTKHTSKLIIKNVVGDDKTDPDYPSMYIFSLCIKLSKRLEYDFECRLWKG